MITEFKPSDSKEMLALMEDAIVEIEPDASPNRTDILTLFTEVLKQNSMIYLKLYRIDGVIAGFVGGIINKGLMVNQIFAHALIAYFKPDYRGNGYVFELYDDFERWARSRGAHKIALTATRDPDTLDKAKADTLGLTIQGTTLTKNLTK